MSYSKASFWVEMENHPSALENKTAHKGLPSNYFNHFIMEIKISRLFVRFKIDVITFKKHACALLMLSPQNIEINSYLTILIILTGKNNLLDPISLEGKNIGRK